MTKLRFELRNISLLTILITLGTAAVSQPAEPARQKALTPEQVRYRTQIEEWRTARQELRAKANAALEAEMARERTGDCPNAVSTRAAEECLNAEIATTEKNYLAFTSALRAMLALPYPASSGQQPIAGPTGTPPTSAELTAQFDRIENESKKYRDLCVNAAYNQFKGGTEAPVFALEAQQRLLRLHLHELSFLYTDELSNH